jgi:hypothetical protein
LTLFLPVRLARVEVRFPRRPADGVAVLDQADMLDGADLQGVQDVGATLQRDYGVPLIVGTSNALSDYGAQPWRAH